MMLNVVIVHGQQLNNNNNNNNFRLNPRGRHLNTPPNNNNNNNNNNLDDTPVVGTVVATSTTVIAGKCRAFINKLRQVDLSQIHLGMNGSLDWTDLAILAVLGWVTEPVGRLVYQWTRRPATDVEEQQQQQQELNVQRGRGWSITREQAYKKTWLYRISSTIGQLGRVIGLVYLTDISTLVLRKIGFQLPPSLNRRLANLIYALFGAQKVRQAKHWWLRNFFGKNQTDSTLTGRERVLEMVVDASIGLLLFFMIQDIFSLTMGRSLQSLFAIGGLSGIMISLASKGTSESDLSVEHLNDAIQPWDLWAAHLLVQSRRCSVTDIAQLLLSGFVIRSSDKWIEGELIKLGDGTTGTITYLGAFEMHIRGGDGIVTRIPNSQVVNQRVQTLSRMTTSQVKQTLWFRYDDIQEIPLLLQSIEEQIQTDCNTGDKLLSVRALWTDFKEDHLEVVVSAQFTINPTASEYNEMKQKVLFAIAQAVHKNNIEFAIPTSICKNENISK